MDIADFGFANAIGYVRENVVTACTTCNIKKGSTPYAEFIAWIRAVAAHLALDKSFVHGIM